MEMNYFYDLPEVLQEKILNIRDNNMAKKIQKLYYNWQGQYMKIHALVSLSEQLYYYDENTMPMIEISTERSARIVEFIQRAIKKNDKSLCREFCTWKNLLIDIHNGLLIEEYLSGPNSCYYNRVENAFYNILNNLHLNWLFDDQEEYFMYY